MDAESDEEDKDEDEDEDNNKGDIDEDGDIDIEDSDVSEEYDEEEWDGPEPSLENCYNKPGMVLVDDRFCIDEYEAVAMENSDCTGKIYGHGEDDFPSGFGNCVDCIEDGFCDPENPGLHGACPFEEPLPMTEPLYACAKPGVLPSAYVSWYQARKACINSGKSLCHYDDWVMACAGPDGNLLPYGNEYVEGYCWDSGLWDKQIEHDGPTETGSNENCVSHYGAYDMSGNLMEWMIDLSEFETYAMLGGGYWFTPGDNPIHLMCDWLDNYGWSSRYKGGDRYGFRCCLYEEEKKR